MYIKHRTDRGFRKFLALNKLYFKRQVHTFECPMFHTRDRFVQPKRMKNLFILILTSSLQLTFGQTADLTIENVKKEADFSFPIIRSSDSLIEFKINTHLQLAELELIRGHEKTDIFEKVSFNNGTIYGGKVDISYRELQNTRNV